MSARSGTARRNFMTDREASLPFGWVISTDDQFDGNGNHVVVAYHPEHEWTIVTRSSVSHEAAFAEAVREVIDVETPDGGDFHVAFVS